MKKKVASAPRLNIGGNKGFGFVADISSYEYNGEHFSGCSGHSSKSKQEAVANFWKNWREMHPDVFLELRNGYDYN